jgi:hypothetical protein
MVGCRSAFGTPMSGLSLRKRGSVAVSTTGSRTVTSTVARPSLVEFHATAMTRAVPANSGISKLSLFRLGSYFDRAHQRAAANPVISKLSSRSATSP